MSKPDVVSIIRGEFAKSPKLTVRQIRNLSPELDNANLVRKGFKALIAAGDCTLEGSKRGSHYVKK